MSDLSNTVYKAVIQAKNKLGNLITKAKLKVIGPSTYDESSGVKNHTITDLDIELVIDKFNSLEVDEIQVKSSDLKIIMFNTENLIPSLNDKITLSGVSYDIVKVNPINAGDKVVVFILQLRK